MNNERDYYKKGVLEQAFRNNTDFECWTQFNTENEFKKELNHLRHDLHVNAATFVLEIDEKESETHWFIGFLYDEISSIITELYNVMKGARPMALLDIDRRYENWLKEEVTKHDIYYHEDKLHSNEERLSFFIYRNRSDLVGLYMIEQIRDAVVYEWLLGKLLGYAPDEMHNHLMDQANTIKQQMIDEGHPEDANTVNDYTDLIGRVKVNFDEYDVEIVDEGASPSQNS